MAPVRASGLRSASALRRLGFGRRAPHRGRAFRCVACRATGATEDFPPLVELRLGDAAPDELDKEEHALGREDRAALAAAAFLRRAASAQELLPCPPSPTLEERGAKSATPDALGHEEQALGREERGARAAAEFLRRTAAATEMPACPGRPAVAGAARRVKFAQGPPSVLAVIPYSEIYGLHPRQFVFGRDYGMIPAQGQFGYNGFDFVSDDVDDEEDDSSECESDDEFDEFDHVCF